MKDLDDDELRTRFAELKKLDRSNAPAFDAKTVLGVVGRRSSPWRVIVPVMSLAAAAALLLLIGAHQLMVGSESAPAVAPVATASSVMGGEEIRRGTAAGLIVLDPAPLDFLLDTSSSSPRDMLPLPPAVNPPRAPTTTPNRLRRPSFPQLDPGSRL